MDYKPRDINFGMDWTKFICNGQVVDYDCIGKTANCPSQPQMDERTIHEIMRNAVTAKDSWSKMKRTEYIACIRDLMRSLELLREEVVRVVMWDACKSRKEAALEFDNTMQFMTEAARQYEAWNMIEQTWKPLPVTFRSPVGIVVCWSADVNTFIETFKILVPALLTGNVVIVKMPYTGGLVHVLTMPTVMHHLPPHVVQYVVGTPDVVAEPLMSGGEVSMLAMTGDRELADKVIHAHPNPHRLKLSLKLDAESIAVLLPDANLHQAASEVTATLRCNWHQTHALKHVMVHYTRAEEFLHLLSATTKGLKCGLPWTAGVDITPLPGEGKPEYLQVRMGAMVVNSADGGGRLLPEFHGTVMKPAVVYPVNDTMQLWTVSRTGPIVAVTSYRHFAEVSALVCQRPIGIQVSLFTANYSNRANSPDSSGSAETLAYEEVLQDVVRSLPGSVGAVVVNRICADQCFEGYGGGLNCACAERDEKELFRAFTTETSLHHFASAEDNNAESTCTTGKMPVRSTSVNKLPDLLLDNSVLIPTSFPSPVGIAEINKL